jgi:hypothetical protein
MTNDDVIRRLGSESIENVNACMNIDKGRLNNQAVKHEI